MLIISNLEKKVEKIENINCKNIRTNYLCCSISIEKPFSNLTGRKGS